MADSVKLREASSNSMGFVLTDLVGLEVADSDVKLTLVDENGTEVAGVSWPQTMAYVTQGL